MMKRDEARFPIDADLGGKVQDDERHRRFANASLARCARLHRLRGRFLPTRRRHPLILLIALLREAGRRADGRLQSSHLTTVLGSKSRSKYCSRVGKSQPPSLPVKSLGWRVAAFFFFFFYLKLRSAGVPLRFLGSRSPCPCRLRSPVLFPLPNLFPFPDPVCSPFLDPVCSPSPPPPAFRPASRCLFRGRGLLQR